MQVLGLLLDLVQLVVVVHLLWKRKSEVHKT
jgi:hypothetical protein